MSEVKKNINRLLFLNFFNTDWLISGKLNEAWKDTVEVSNFRGVLVLHFILILRHEMSFTDQIPKKIFMPSPEGLVGFW